MMKFPQLVPALLVATLLSACTQASLHNGVAAPQSGWVQISREGRLTYKTDERGDRIMDFSYAGYMGGGVKLPEVPAVKRIRPLGNGRDDSANIQGALDEIGKMPLRNGFRGALELGPGTYVCSQTLVISSSGVVLRGSGARGAGASTLQLTGKPHVGIRVGLQVRRGERNEGAASDEGGTTIAEGYVPAGAMSFTVKDAAGIKAGDWIAIRRPVTPAWVHFMAMDDMTRNGEHQTWIREGTTTDALRRVEKVSGNRVTVDVPLSDSFDARYVPNARVVKVGAPALASQIGLEHFHMECPPQEQNHTQPHYQAFRLSGEDCWARDIVCDETMNSVSVGGRRITVTEVAVNRKAPHLGASKPAEFAPNGTQVLLDRCSVSADNVWFSATGAGVSGPIVLLNCTFRGHGAAEAHQRWSTGMLYDNVRAPEGELEMRNRGEMGSGHGWGMGWGVLWNCDAKDYIVQNPPGAMNWMIGCVGKSDLSPRPFGDGPLLPEGVVDSAGVHVVPQSLYLAQLRERLGAEALENIGYDGSGRIREKDVPVAAAPSGEEAVDRTLGANLALHRPVETSSVRDNDPRFFGDNAIDNNEATYWATKEGVTTGTLEIDTEGAANINTAVIEEGPGCRNLAYTLEGMVNGEWKMLSQGTAVGVRKVDHFPETTVWKVRLTIKEAEGCVAIRELGLYHRETK
ncbi:MAG: hypothetical protein ACTHN5_14155 [Phycisphaerae bacterium]